MEQINTDSIGTDNRGELITFYVAEQLFGFPIESVHAVVNPSTITPVPRAPLAVVGITNLHSNIACVLDAHVVFGLTTEPPAKRYLTLASASGPSYHESERGQREPALVGISLLFGEEIYILLVDRMGDITIAASGDAHGDVHGGNRAYEGTLGAVDERYRQLASRVWQIDGELVVEISVNALLSSYLPASPSRVG